MKKEVYNAIRARISVVDCPDFYEEYPDTPKDAILYKFDAAGLNDDENDDFMFDIVHAMTAKNMWNVAQRFFWILNNNHLNVEHRLLKKQ